MSSTSGPAVSETEVVLRDGRIIRLRPVAPGDKDRVRALFEGLSPHSRYLRFHHARKAVSETELEQMVHGCAPERCAYLGMTGDGEREAAVALGEWHLLPGGDAEIAFTVSDTIQVMGIGTALLEILAETATRCGIKAFRAIVLPDNARMLQVFEDSGFHAVRKLEGGVYTITLDLGHRDEFEQRRDQREHIARCAGVRRVLQPRSVAVIGASRNPQSIGGGLFRNLLSGGFTGTLFPVNPSAPSVFGVLAYPSVLEVPGEVDLAVIAVPAERALEVVEQCGRKGVRGLLVISAGFTEVGEEGRERQRALREKALGYGMRMVGPNCLGLLNNDAQVRLNATFAPVTAPPGKISVGSESGAVGLAVLEQARKVGIGVNSFVSLGNRADISSNDLLELWEDDPNTEVILLYLESFGNPRKFSRIARRVSRKKPIIAVKAGRSAAGARAAQSHTGALAGADVAVDALFAQAGVIRVDGVAEMFHAARTLAHQPPPRGPGVGIVTNAGGLGVMAADACEGHGLVTPPLTAKTQLRLRSFLAAEAAVANPVDAIAAVSPQHFGQALSAVLQDPGIDAAIALYIPPLVTTPREMAAAVQQAQAEHQGDKPLLACFMTQEDTPDIEGAGGGRTVPVFAFPEDAVQALAGAYQFARQREQPAGRVPPPPAADADRARAVLGRARGGPGNSLRLLPEDACALLREYGIPAVETLPATSAAEATEVARRLGFPVAMKVRSTAIVHKTDVGGIALGLSAEQEVPAAYIAMEQRVKAAGLSMEGVVLQPMVRGGQEMIVGMAHDPVFGPLIMTGVGGVNVELFKDVAFALHPLTDLDPDRMLALLKGLPLLKGWRGSPPRDIDALKDMLLRFSALVEDLGEEIQEMEINPLMVLERGKGCLAVDARVAVRPRG